VAPPHAAVLIFSPSGFHRVIAAMPVHSEAGKQYSCQVATMVLSEARGLWLFRVIREGLGSSERLCARDTQRLTSQRRLALEPMTPTAEQTPIPVDMRLDDVAGK
jgi:hypothetical protein